MILEDVIPEFLAEGACKALEVVLADRCISVGVDRMQRDFEPMRKQVEAWQRSELTDVTPKVVVSEAFVEGKLEAPKHLARTVHDLYFEPKYEEFEPRTIWSLSNAFTSVFKELDPILQFKGTAKLGEFLEARFSQSFWPLGRCRPAAAAYCSLLTGGVARKPTLPATDFPQARFRGQSTASQPWTQLREAAAGRSDRGAIQGNHAS